MQRFVVTILVIVVCLVSLSTSVQAQTTYEVPVGGIAIIGFNFDDPNQFAFVCLVNIPSGTEIRFTDKGWTSDQQFGELESIFPWYTPGGCNIGDIVIINTYDYRNDTTGELFDFSSSGDQLFVYQYISTQTHLIFGLNSESSDWQLASDGTNKSISTLPTIFTTYNPRPAIALNEIDNSVYVGTREFKTTTDALAAIVNKANWSGSDTDRQIFNTTKFSFTTTAVHLSDFNAETGEKTAPWWIIAGLVVIPVLVMVVKRPKRECCK